MLSNKKRKSKVMPNLNSFYNSFKHIASEQEQGEYECVDNDEDMLIIDQEMETFLNSNLTSEEIVKW